MHEFLLRTEGFLIAVIVFGLCAIIGRVREQMRRDAVIEDSDTWESLR